MRVRTQAIVCAAAWLVLGTAVGLPETWAEHKANQAAQALRERLARELPTGSTIDQAQAWVLANPMASWIGPGVNEARISATAEIPGDLGGVFHEPQSLQIWFDFSIPSQGQPARLAKAEVERWPFLTLRSGSAGRYPVKWIKALPMIPAFWLIFLGVRHSHRLYRGEFRRLAGRCPDCNYQMGPSDHCSECGREIASIRPRR